MGAISEGMSNMYEEQQTLRRRGRKTNLVTPTAMITIAAVGALLPAPQNLMVWGAGAAGLVLAKGLDNEVA